jgi:hypothetical protein
MRHQTTKQQDRGLVAASLRPSTKLNASRAKRHSVTVLSYGTYDAFGSNISPTQSTFESERVSSWS